MTHPTKKPTSQHNPRNIQPLGNLLLSINPTQTSIHRINSLGSLSILSDEIILKIFSELDPSSLHLLQGVSRYFFGWCVGLDGLWKSAYLSQHDTLENWNGTWRSTFLGRSHLETDPIQLNQVYSDVLFQPILAATYDISSAIGIKKRSNKFRPTIQRVSVDSKSIIERKIPQILLGLMETWSARKWTLDTLSARFPNVKFRAESSLISLSNYQLYHHRCQTEESPVYLFDADFVEKTSGFVETQSLGLEYHVPEVFGNDLLGSLGPDQRPDFRWLIIGPTRSGSTWHKDPNGTSAWNAVISGKKLWICFPPDCTPPGVRVSEDESEVESPLSIAEWFINYYELSKEEFGPKAQDPSKRGKMLEGICEAGEIFYVPSGWWHLVVNLEPSIAITQNFVSEHELVEVLKFMKSRSDQLSGFRKIERMEEVLEKFINALRSNPKLISAEVLNESLNRIEEKQVGINTKNKRKNHHHGQSEGSMWEKLKQPRLEETIVNESNGFCFGFLVEEESL
ncbi:uncharacterized protein MELLADRAFT_117407 [Melampsora larici-populina 98AG31]|uniref:JmjC domain-containing protein n=1 Tax=Melampsora larici-populina (strain 98AG31 / pathotype 3-4-7) TaxID=747676 RepID=F4RWS8_MELLP|nr:uncharacterized protein MELLADRAFT_117407 [Melampsora larici-populina 98AG31]EGG03173.1 hypothetical protein MELLADRAFT_117407 [Melampsora larici-populina 98AG31]